MFRNSSRYLDRYGAQCAALRDALQERGDTLRLIVAEGDSTDDTPVMLPKVLQEHHGLTATILKVDHGGPEGVDGLAERGRNWRRRTGGGVGPSKYLCGPPREEGWPEELYLGIKLIPRLLPWAVRGSRRER